jgi:DNA polymerase I-like protein with 3'-5' exonuclease and polymerase domains
MAGEDYQKIVTADVLERHVERIIKGGKDFAFDIESDHHWPNPKKPQPKGALLTEFPGWFLVGFSFTDTEDGALYVPVQHKNGGNIDDPVRAAKALYRLLETGRGVAHNAMFDVKGCARWFRDTLSTDAEFAAIIEANYGILYPKSDTMVEVYCDGETPPPTAKGPGLSLKGLVKYYFHHDQKEFISLFMEEGQTKKPAAAKAKFSDLDVSPKVVSYAAEDAKWTLALHNMFMARLKQDAEAMRIYQLEMALVPTLLDMEIEGLALDWGRIATKHREIIKFREAYNEQIMSDLSERLDEIVNINLGSVPQLSEILFDRLGLPVKIRSKKTGNASTGVKALQAIAKADPIVKSILQYREIVKLQGSYLKKYEQELSYSPRGRAFPTHKQTGAATGRLSVDGVSYQQWPKPYHYELRSGLKYDLNFRDLLVSPPGTRIIGFDFSQVELRIAAGMSGEKNLLDAFNSGIDIHKATASTMLKMPLDQITKKERSIGKTLNFATFYGTGPANVAEMLTSPDKPVTKEDAEKMLAAYFDGFPRLRAWMDEKLTQGKRTGMVRTHFGRKFKIWEYTSHDSYIKSKGDRMCINAPVQGGAADYMKFGMVRVRAAIKKAEAEGRIPERSIRLVMTIHDALEFYVSNEVPTQTVIDIVQPAVSFPVPKFPDIEILAEWHEGHRWGSVVEIKMDSNKQITHYEVEDVDQKFPTVEYAQAYLASKNLQIEKASASIEIAPDDDDAGEESGEEIGWGTDTVLVPKYDDDPETEDAPIAPPAAATEDEPVWAHRPQASQEVEAVDQATPDPAARVAVVTMADMPFPQPWSEFKQYLQQRPGNTEVKVITPQGAIVFDTKHDLSGEDQPFISLILNGADLHFESVDADFDLEGLEL